ncbi:MAG: ribosome recycling factor [Anaerolineales bacterium]
MVKEALRDAESRMSSAVRVLQDDLATMRTGRASPLLVEKLSVIYYDQPTPLNQLATISVPEPRLLAIRPFDPASIKNIEKAILASDLGLTPTNDGKLIRLAIPTLTEERRRDLLKIVGSRLEDARVAVRNVRRDAQNDMREFEREKLISEDELERGQKDLQDLTDRQIERINDVGKKKEEEIMQV